MEPSQGFASRLARPIVIGSKVHVLELPDLITINDQMNLDDKGRVVLPKNLIRILRRVCGVDEKQELRLRYTIYTHGGIQVHPPADFLRLARILQERSLDSEEAARRYRIFMGNADEIVVDKANRIRIPAHIIQSLGFKKVVQMVGQGDHFELWHPEAWKKYHEELRGHVNQPFEKAVAKK
ncbi:MAG: hypothetical protein V2A74_02645 [bacterium]